MSYDDALFYQRIRQQARDGRVRRADVEAAFWSVAWDLRLALQQHRPESVDSAEQKFRDELLPTFVQQIKRDLGIDVID